MDRQLRQNARANRLYLRLNTEKNGQLDMDTIVALILLAVTIEVWFPVATIWGIIKLIFTFSISAGWEAFKSVPLWIWSFVNNLL